MIDYIKIDSDILNLPLTGAEKLVLAAGRLPKGCRMSNAQLAGICGVSLRTLIRIVMELKNSGLIRVHKSGSNRTIFTADNRLAGYDRLTQRQNDTCQDGVKSCQNVTKGCQAVTEKCQIDTHNLKNKRNKKEKAASRTKEPSGGALCSSPSEEKTSGHGGREKTRGDIGDFTMKEFREYIADRLGMKPGGENYASRAYELRIAIFTAGSRENAEFLEWVRKRREGLIE
ncbi:winged helix-turn-helix transcriptional regulator [Sedimentisphaera salicampi]|uniref:Helix-turn-helix domain-containing protein n=1 Tax=Sedimentisphaera salicampi TaxID=1941349 RepID=A0A1W6LNR3_9BACT|nr:winged helix-turn-helix transcriptional regulator [Sedimentisphaera salicampi]ARN57435.1 hypothetical protein STSP1_01842 [Sedimentisphaera salicampi]